MRIELGLGLCSEHSHATTDLYFVLSSPDGEKHASA
jgi:hypothetical protein